MTTMTDMTPKQPGNKPTMHDQLRRAMIAKGWLIPLIPDEVEIAEKAMPNVETEALPASLADPFSILDGPSREPEARRPAPPSLVDETIAKAWSRAAREGKDISEDIEAKMRADREAAERDDGD